MVSRGLATEPLLNGTILPYATSETDKTHFQFLYSYRVVNHKDLIPRVPPLGGPDEIWHHRYEIWYNNRMAKGDPWQLSPEGDGHYGANAQVLRLSEPQKLDNFSQMQ